MTDTSAPTTVPDLHADPKTKYSLEVRVRDLEQKLHIFEVYRNVAAGTFAFLVSIGIFSSWQGWIEPFKKIDYNKITQDLKQELRVSDVSFFENPTQWFDKNHLKVISSRVDSELKNIEIKQDTLGRELKLKDIDIISLDSRIKNLNNNIDSTTQLATNVKSTVEDARERLENLTFKIERQAQTAIGLVNSLGRSVIDATLRERTPEISLAVADVLRSDDDFRALILAQLMPQHSVIATFAECPQAFQRVARISLREQRRVQLSTLGDDPTRVTSHDIFLCKVGSGHGAQQASTVPAVDPPKSPEANPR